MANPAFCSARGVCSTGHFALQHHSAQSDPDVLVTGTDDDDQGVSAPASRGRTDSSGITTIVKAFPPAGRNLIADLHPGTQCSDGPSSSSLPPPPTATHHLSWRSLHKPRIFSPLGPKAYPHPHSLLFSQGTSDGSCPPSFITTTTTTTTTAVSSTEQPSIAPLSFPVSPPLQLLPIRASPTVDGTKASLSRRAKLLEMSRRAYHMTTSSLIHASFEANLRSNRTTATPLPSSPFLHHLHDDDDDAMHGGTASPVSPSLTFAMTDESFDSDASAHDGQGHPVRRLTVADPAANSIDYFSYKAQTYYPNPKATTTTTSVGAESDNDPTPTNTIRKRNVNLGSYFSPAITPAPSDATQQSMASPAAYMQAPLPSFHHRPALSAWLPTLAGTPECDPFPYIAYESTYHHQPDHFESEFSSFHLVAPTPSPPLTTHARTPPPPPTTDEVTIKVYFRHSDDIVKFRCDRTSTSLADFVRQAARRMPSGWEALYGAEDPKGWCVQDIAQACEDDRERMVRLGKDDEWERWLERSLENGGKRLILWAI